MTTDMELVVDAGGDVRCIYGEELDLREIGKLQITHICPPETVPVRLDVARPQDRSINRPPSGGG